MKVTVQLFGYLAEKAGRAKVEVEVSAGCDVAAVVETVAREILELSRLDPSVTFAVNTGYAKADTPVQSGDIVSFLPPVGGG